MRGTQPGDEVEVELRGIIPAYAGNTARYRNLRKLYWDPSPRMRGTPAAWPARSASKWIIPAYAGNTICRFRSNRDRRDHPRVCGEHSTTPVVTPKQQGSSPRMRGTHACPRKTTRNRMDHPRVCGEHWLPSCSRLSNWGSSPRMRGTPKRTPPPPRPPRIIPAYAGNTSHILRWRGAIMGSSPRMRGTRLKGSYHMPTFGIIPAYAGNTCPKLAASMLHRDHPRVCGEHFGAVGGDVAAEGSSPRMRGTLLRVRAERQSTGIIPAYAGNTRCRTGFQAGCGDHPRVCGEHQLDALVGGIRTGSSPRMRGTRVMQCDNRACGGIIPAYAGNTIQMRKAIFNNRDHPRVCGEHPWYLTSTPSGWRIIPAYAGNTPKRRSVAPRSRDHPRVCGEHRPAISKLTRALGSSPRMRGTQDHGGGCEHGSGIIPAYAGNTLVCGCECYVSWDHPRVCGEHPPRPVSGCPWLGSSPRMRGTRFIQFTSAFKHGIIPAYAGNTPAQERPTSL